jgi:NADH:ubiquinone oxidoreductase subunit 5 (subunit L)/multisubunit Na+/H+ antiporter MnhA subunit
MEKMSGENLLLLSVFVPLVGAFLLPLAGAGWSGFRNVLALVFVSVSFIASAMALPAALSGNPYIYRVDLPLGFNFGLLGDGLAIFMAMVSSLVGAVIVFYSFGYISHYKNQNEYYFMVVLFLGSMMGLVYSTNLIFLYLFWEISAICCWRLIGFYREREYVFAS